MGGRSLVFAIAEGKISLSAPSHVSLLLQGTFNASISAPHISEKHWEFVYNDADGSDGKAGRAGKSAGDGDDSSIDDAGEGAEDKQDEEEEEEDYSNQSIGYWRNKKDGTRLGEESGKVTFTVISMTVANGMLSLHGSLLKRPFSVPPPSSEETKMSLLPQQIAFGALAHGANEPLSSSGKRVRWHDEEEEDDDDGAPTSCGMGEDDQANSSFKSSKQSSRNTQQGFAPRVSMFSKATGAAVQSQGKKINFDD